MGANETKKAGLLSRKSVEFKRRSWLHIDKPQKGTIRSDKPVWLMATGAVAGHIIAPQIVISGILYGSAAARELTIEETGKVWGDIYALSFTMEANAFIQGWIGSMPDKEAGFKALLDGSKDLDDWRVIETPLLPDELLPTWVEEITPESLLDGDNRLALMRQLQQEAGEALVQMARLDDDYAAAVADQAGITRVQTVELQRDLAEIQEHFSELTAQHQTVLTKKQALEKSLMKSESELSEREADLAELREIHASQVATVLDLEQGKQEAMENLAVSRADAADYHSDLVALQAEEKKLQEQIIEQQDVMLQWQDLLEKNETTIAALEKGLEQAESQRDNEKQKVTKMRQQRDEYKIQAEQLHSELAEKPISQTLYQSLQDELETVKSSADATREELDSVLSKAAALKMKYTEEHRRREEGYIQFVDFQTEAKRVDNERLDMLRTLKKDRTSLRRQLKTLTTKSEKKALQLSSEVETMKVAVQQALQDKQAYVDKLAALQDEMKENEEAAAKAERIADGRINSLQTQLKQEKVEMSANIEALQVKVDLLQTRFVEASTTAVTVSQKAEDEVQQVRFESELVIAEEREQLFSMETEIAALRAKLNETEAREIILEADFAGMRQEKTAAAAEIGKLQGLIDAAEMRENSLIEQLAERESSLTIIQETAVADRLAQKKLSEEVAAFEQRFADMEAQLTAQEKSFVEKLQIRDLKLEAQEKEVATYYEQTESQRERLAEIRVDLVNRDLELAATNQQLEETRGELARIKKEAKQYIRQLEIKVSQLREQLKLQAEQLVMIKQKDR